MPKPIVLTLPSPQPSCGASKPAKFFPEPRGPLCCGDRGQGTAQNPWDQSGGSLAAPGTDLLKGGSQGTANCKLQTAKCPSSEHLEHSKFQTALFGHIWGTTNCSLPSLGTRGGPRAGSVPVPEPALSSHTLGPVQACCNLRRHFPGTSDTAFHPEPGTKGVLFPPIPSWESGVTQAASQILCRLIPELIPSLWG